MTMSTLASDPTLTLAAQGVFLVSFWKPLILLVTISGWAWIVSQVYDKHAARFFLPREQWNTAHLIAGLLAFVVALAIPLKGEGAFWIGWGVMILILVADLFAYAMVANKDERVPEAHHIRLSMLADFSAKREAKKKAKSLAQVTLVIRGPDKQLVGAPQAETPEYEARAAAEQMFITAQLSRASQLDLAPGPREGVYQPSTLVDGVRNTMDPIPAGVALKVIDFWKACAKLDVAERRRKLVGEIVIEQGSGKQKVRVTAAGVQGGMRMTLLFEPDTAVTRKIELVGLLDAQIAELRELVADTGVVLIAAMPDQGRTTTFYSIIRMHDAYVSNVQTLEMEPQAALEGVRSNKFEPTAEGAEYATTARSILRRDPDVLALAELPDANTAKEVVKADTQRTRIYVSLKADSAMGAIESWVKAVGDAAAASKVLHGVIAQRLVRKLCENCRVAYPPTPDMLKKLGVPADKVQQLFKKGGQVLIKNKPEICPACRGVGYVGQEAIVEVYRLGDDERRLAAAQDFAGLRAALRKRQLPGIQQAAIAKAVEGKTSVEEIMRVMNPAPASAPAPAQPAAAPQAKPAAKA